LGIWKPLLPWHGHTLVQSVVAVALRSSRRVVVVARGREPDLRQMFSGMVRVEVVASPAWEVSSVSSLLRGAQAVAPGGFYLAVVDLPPVMDEQFEELNRMAAGLPRGRPAGALRSGSHEFPGYPVLFDAGVHEILAQMSQENSMNDLWSSVATHWCPENPTLSTTESSPDYPAPGSRLVVLVSGSRGSGKSEALGRLSKLLRARKVAFVREDDDLEAATASGVRVAILDENATAQRKWALEGTRTIPVLAVRGEHREELAREAKNHGFEPVWLDLDLGIGMPDLVAESLEAAVVVALSGQP